MSHVLLVDDDADMLKLTERWFMKAGYEVSVATSGEEALSAIQADERTKNIPVLFRTGKDDEKEQAVMESLHPAGVVSKADGKPQLMKAVESILSK